MKEEKKKSILPLALFCILVVGIYFDLDLIVGAFLFLIWIMIAFGSMMALLVYLKIPLKLPEPKNRRVPNLTNFIVLILLLASGSAITAIGYIVFVCLLYYIINNGEFNEDIDYDKWKF